MVSAGTGRGEAVGRRRLVDGLAGQDFGIAGEAVEIGVAGVAAEGELAEPALLIVGQAELAVAAGGEAAIEGGVENVAGLGDLALGIDHPDRVGSRSGRIERSRSGAGAGGRVVHRGGRISV